MLKIGICTRRTGFKKYAKDVLRGVLCGYENWIIEEISVSALLEKKRAVILE